MKRITLIILAVLIFSLMSSTSLSVTTAQNTAPELHEVSIVEINVTIGDTITVQVNVTHSYGISYLDVFLHGPSYLTVDNNNPIWVGSFQAQYNASTGYFEGTYIIQEYDPEEITVGELYVQDSNNDGWWFSNPLIYDYQEPEFHFSSNIVNVYNSNPDYEAPILQWYYYSQSTVQPGESLKILVNATDDKSGVSYVWISINRDSTTSEYPWDDEQMISLQLLFNATSGLFEGEVNVLSYHQSGDYYISYLDMQDAANNYNYYETYAGAQNYLEPNYFYVDNTNYIPVISEMYFEYTTVDQATSQMLYLNISNPDIESINSGGMDIIYDHPQYDYEYIGWLSFDSTNFNDVTGLYEIPFSNADFHSTVPQNTDISIKYVWIYQQNNQYINLREGQSFTSPIFQVTGEFNDPADIVIDAPNRVVQGHSSDIGVSVISNEYFGIEGNVSIEVSGPETAQDNFNFVFESYGQEDLSLSYDFNTTGTYTVEVSYYTGLGVFTESASWEVVEATVDPPVDDDEDPEEPTNSTGVPQIDLPGFEFYVTFAGFTSMLLLTYQSRRKFN